MTASPDREREAKKDSDQAFWYEALNLFPIVFLPIAALVGVLCAWIMPYLTNAHRP